MTIKTKNKLLTEDCRQSAIKKNILIAGVGGQGTILAARLIGDAAMKKGIPVRGSETIGMAQRGGSVIGHIRLGEGVFSPLIPQRKADLILAFEPGEAVRSADYLSPGGICIVCDRAVNPVSTIQTVKYSPRMMVDWLRCAINTSQNKSRLFIADGDKIMAKINIRCLNVVLLGIAAGLGELPFEPGDVEDAIKERLNERFRDMNIEAFRFGIDAYNHFLS